jgi:hypothetical protein
MLKLSDYTGQRCQTNVVASTDACRPVSPCLNGGTCMNVVNGNPGYACICSSRTHNYYKTINLSLKFQKYN